MRTKLGVGLLALAALVLTGGSGMAGGTKLKVGDKVEKIEGADETGKTWSGKDLLGKKTIILYFYPADFTGGCTSQACGFRDDIEKLGSKDIVVIGVSGDTSETHARFKKHHKLPFTLLADIEGKIATQFGVPFSKGDLKAKVKIDGIEEVIGRPVSTSRFTVVIGKDRTILAIDPIKNAGGDAKRVMELIEKSSK